MTGFERSKPLIISSIAAVALIVFVVVAGPSLTGHPSTTVTPYCLIQVPASAQIGYYHNLTFNGNVVAYANGTNMVFSYYSCPRPAMGDAPNGPPLDTYSFTTNVFAMAAAAEGNDTFAALEHGSSYLFTSTSGLVCTALTDNCGLDLFFYRYGDNASHPCGLTSYERNVLEGILVGFVTTGNYDVGGQWISHGWDLKNPTFHALSSDEIETYTAVRC